MPIFGFLTLDPIVSLTYLYSTTYMQFLFLLELSELILASISPSLIMQLFEMERPKRDQEQIGDVKQQLNDIKQQLSDLMQSVLAPKGVVLQQRDLDLATNRLPDIGLAEAQIQLDREEIQQQHILQRIGAVVAGEDMNEDALAEILGYQEEVQQGTLDPSVAEFISPSKGHLPPSPIQLGNHHAGQIHALLEHPGLDDRIVPEGGIEDNPVFMGGTGQRLANGALHLLQFIHQGLLGVHTAGGINQHHVGLSRHGGFRGIKCHRRGIRPMGPHHHIEFEPIRPQFELMRPCRTEGVCRGQ